MEKLKPVSASSSLIQAGPRPRGLLWTGESWLCSQAMRNVESEWVLFVDVGIRLVPDAVKGSLHRIIKERTDLSNLEFFLLTVAVCLASLGFQLGLRIWVKQQFLLPLNTGGWQG